MEETKQENKKYKLVIVKATPSINIDDSNNCFTLSKQMMLQKQEDGSIVINIIVDENYNLDDDVSLIRSTVWTMGFDIISPILIQHEPKVDKIEV